MAVVIRLLFVCILISLLYGADPASPRLDSLQLDSTALALPDSNSVSDKPAISAWVVPLLVVGATAGVFVLLFTARSK